MPVSSISKNTGAGVENFANAFDDLSRRHYKRNGSDLLRSLATEDLARRQYARLLGVMVKQPFTVDVPRRKSIKTRSVIALRWRSEPSKGPRLSVGALPDGTEDLWQSQFLRALAKLEYPKESNANALRLLMHDARYESRLGEHIFRAFRRYLCKEGPHAKNVEKAIGKARRKHKARSKRSGGLKPSDFTVSGMKFHAASLVALSVAHSLPRDVALYAAPLIAGVAFMLMEVGLNGFCEWSAEMDKTSQLKDAEQEDKAPG